MRNLFEISISEIHQEIEISPINIMGRLPNLSERYPQKIDVQNCAIEKEEAMNPT